ncbi:hypothetical protein VPH35_049711 [Triticum aestivum]
MERLRRSACGLKKKKRIRNRASQECLTALTDNFTDDQKGAAAEMGMQSMMAVRCTNLVNPVCDWLAEIYEPASREFVIPGRGRLPLNEESEFCTLGVPRGHIKVPYEVNNEIEEALFPRLFPGSESMPNTSAVADSLQAMTTHGDVFKMKLLMYLISAIFAPTTSLRPSNKCFPILLMAKHAIDYNVFGGPQNFGKWMDVHSAPSCPTEARAPVEHLIGQFASGMTGLLGKLVEGWTSLSGSDSDAVARVKKTTTRGAKHTSKDPLERLHSKLSTGGNSDVHEAPGDSTAAASLIAPTNSDASGRSSPPAADVQARTTDIRTSGSDGSVSARTSEILPTLLAMKDDAVSHATPSASVEVDAPETNLSKEDSRSSDTDSKRVRGRTPVSTTEAAEAAVHKDMPSTGESPGTTAPAPVDADTAKATVSRAGLPPRRCSPRKQPTDIPNASAAARSRRDEPGYVPASTLFPPPAKRNVMEKPEDQSTTDAGVKPGASDAGERPEQTAPLPASEIPSINLRTSRLPVNVGVPYSPNKKIVKKVVADTADNTPRPTNKPDHSVAADSDMFVDLSPLHSSPQIVRGPASRNERHPMAFTPSSFSLGISQDQPVVQDPMPVAFAFPGGMPAMMAQPMVEGRKAVKFAEPIVQATPEEISPSLDEAYRMIEEASLHRRSSRGQGQSSSNVPADTVSEDTIRSGTPSSVRQQRVVHPPPAEDYEPEFRATKEQTQLYDIVKQFGNVMFPMFQELAQHDQQDKCGHHYAICLDLKNQCFEVLDSIRSEADADLTTHAEFFINNLKETWNRHYKHSKVQIRHFPTEYVATAKQGNTTDCGFHALEYFAKWEGRIVPAITAAMVVELRKIHTWNWLTNEDFNKQSGAHEFVEEAVKKVIKKYK